MIEQQRTTVMCLLTTTTTARLRAAATALLLCTTMTTAAPAAEPAASRKSGDPIQLAFIEGDVAGFTGIHSPDGKTIIGFVQYRQHRHGDILEAVRIAKFNDGSSDEDRVKAHVGKELRTIGGRTIMRNTKGVATVDVTIDVAGGHITGFSGLGDKRETYDEHVELPHGTYWGPLISIVLKNFERNANDGELVFHTVVVTPKPRAIDMQVLRKDTTTLRRRGGAIQSVDFELRPSVNKLIDPIIQAIAPETNFFMLPGDPPAIARYEGPRNYEGQKIRIE